MSRIIKMGVAAGTIALREAGISVPDAIITGTSFGCLEDTGIFLSKMIENSENALNPTPFIQSTHNTIGSQIALLLQCQGYNQTYTQRGFSFEHALIDAMLELKDNPEQNILAGGIDEITSHSHSLQKRFGIFRESVSSLNLIKQSGDGTLNGEGVVYLALSGKKSDNNNICLEAVSTFYNSRNLDTDVKGFIEATHLAYDDVDLVLMGKSGVEEWDKDLEVISSKMFPKASKGVFKHLCGEYPTASAFATWLAAMLLREQSMPEIVFEKNTRRPLKNILIFNAYFEKYHSLILLRAC
jgi:hypothetical protein